MRIKFKNSLTLLELMIAVSLLSVLVLSFYSLQLFSHRNVVNSDKQALLQNELSLAIEHMGRSVQQAVGDPSQPALSMAPGADGLRVCVEPAAATPFDPTDNIEIDYILSGTTLNCRVNGVFSELLSMHLMPGVAYGPIPDPLPVLPAGFYINIEENASLVEVVLVSRFRSANLVSLDNPQVVMRSRLYARSAASR